MITVIIPTLNEAAYLSRSLPSLRDQTAVRAAPDAFEFIVVDSSSEDGTPLLAESLGWKVLQAPLGKLYARDLAIKEAWGDVIFSGDADTVYPPGHLETFLEHFQDPQVVGVYGPFMIDHPNPILRFFSSIHILHPARFFGMNSMFRKQAYFDVGGFDFSVNQQNHAVMLYEEEDRFYESLSRIGKVVYEPRTMARTSGRRQTGEDAYWSRQREEGRRFSERPSIW